MRKGFRELSVSQRNRRLRALEKQEIDEPTVRFSPYPLTTGRNTNAMSVRDVHTPTINLTTDNSNLNNSMNMLCNVPALETQVFITNNNNLDTGANVICDTPTLETQGIMEYESEDNCPENTDRNQELSSWLCSWKHKHNISHTALSELLSELRKRGHADLPKDARTLLQTPRKSIVKISINGSSNFHYGLKRALIDQLSHAKCEVKNNRILLDLNIDGLPISKSSKSQIWPVLGKIYGNKAFTPFVISAYHGYSKPKSLMDFLTPFCNEYDELQRTGFTLQNKTYTIQIRSVICDSPARAFVTCTKSHNSFFGCGKCTEEGTFSNHRMLFLKNDAPLRTDENFKNRLQDDHHMGTSPLEEIIPMVSRFPLDYMHLVCLGVMKKLLLLWINGYHTARFSGRKIAQLSAKLIAVSK